MHTDTLTNHRSADIIYVNVRYHIHATRPCLPTKDALRRQECLLLLLILGIEIVLAEAPQHGKGDALATVGDDLRHQAAEHES